MKLFYLGPEGTFTHQAAMTAADQFATLGDFDLIALPDVPAIMQAVQSRQGWGVIAWENNVEGYVVPNLDALIDAPNAAASPGSVWTWPSTPSPCAATASTTAPATPSAPTRTVWPNAPGSSPNTICSPNPHPPTPPPAAT